MKPIVDAATTQKLAQTMLHQPPTGVGTLQRLSRDAVTRESEYQYYFQKKPSELFPSLEKLMKHALLRPLLAHRCE